MTTDLNTAQIIKNNPRYKVKTPNGWEDFSGIRISHSYNIIQITTSHTQLKCTADHKLLTANGFVEARNLCIGDEIHFENRLSIVTRVEKLERPELVYDLLDAGETNSYYTNGLVSHNCVFLGSKLTLIAASTLQNMVPDIPIQRDEYMTVYIRPEKDRKYFISCDPSRGTGNDYSAFIVFDITEYPIKICAVYKNNHISPLLLPNILEQTARSYGNAFVLIEINDNGQQVADILYRDLEYENVVSMSFHGNEFGIRTTTSVKRIGCSNFKDVVENQKMLITDIDLISQLFTFVQDKKSFAAEQGNHDDLVMACVIFAYFMTTKMFVDLHDMNLIAAIRDKNMKAIEDELTPFGFFDNGLSDDDEIVIQEPYKGLRYLE